ncbi:MAG: phytanoyl-CoA dioxygenase family protein [Candidatus Poribacteria bacterium]|nr:phytanoyl-CoA dioxygenase family protein [Candidatus Poribacteria bacterium]
MELTEQQVQQYQDSGYTVVRGLISPEEASCVRNRLMDLLEGDHDWPDNHFQILDPSKCRNSNGGFVPIGVQRPAMREGVFEDIADHPNLQSAMAQLLGGLVKRFTDQALIKNPAISGQSFYHQDSYYWHLAPKQGCNSWIALDEVEREGSALAILPGTHESWTLIEHEGYYDEPSFHTARGGEAFKRWRIPVDQIDFSREVLLPMSPGDAAFFTNYTWHRSEPNDSGSYKCAYAIAYQLRENSGDRDRR